MKEDLEPTAEYHYYIYYCCFDTDDDYGGCLPRNQQTHLRHCHSRLYSRDCTKLLVEGSAAVVDNIPRSSKEKASGDFVVDCLNYYLQEQQFELYFLLWLQ